MPKKLLFRPGGQLVFEDPGKLVFNAFGTVPPTTTTTGTVSSCLNGNPEIYVTLFDADYAGGNQSWAGLTFTPTMIQNGTEHPTPACPSSYVKDAYAEGTPTFPTSGSIAARWTHWWNASGLNLNRNIWAYWYNYTTYRIKARNVLSVKSDKDSEQWWGTTANWNNIPGYYYNFPTTPPYGAAQIGKILGVAKPLRNDYFITATASSPWFGSHTVGGIQYSWRTGLGW